MCAEQSEEITEEKIQEMMDYMTDGPVPESILCQPLGLSASQAFQIIWYLQEHLRIIPDHLEKCDGCDVIFDANLSGYYLDDDYELDGKTLPEEYHGHWCDSCVPAVDFKMG